MEIFLLRHGISTSNEKRLVCGASDYPLSDDGRKQAQYICKKLSEIKFSRIYSSPLQRALQTIEYLEKDVDISIVQDLVELDTGESSHLTVDELWENEPRYQYQGLYPELKYPGGECLNDMLERISSWYRKKINTWSYNDKVLIVGHEGTVCGILHDILSVPTLNYPTFNIGNCDCVKITVNKDNQIRYRFIPYNNYYNL